MRILRAPLGLTLLLALAAVPAMATEAVRLERLDDGWIAVTRPPPILGDEEIRRQLTSGLTTTFAFTVEGRGGVQGGARVEVRYHLWDEVYRAAVVEIDGTVRRRELPSREELESWWRELRLRALKVSTVPTGLDRLRITLDVIPFSSREEEDTQRWLSETLARAGDPPRNPPGDRAEEGIGLGQVFNALLATSIRRKAVSSYRWTVAVPARIAPEGGGP